MGLAALAIVWLIFLLVAVLAGEEVALKWIGFVATTAALGVSIAIFVVQQTKTLLREQVEDERHKATMDKLERLAEGSDAADEVAEEPAGGGSNDAYDHDPDLTPLAAEVNVKGRKLRLFTASDIPLQVLADCVKSWTADRIEGQWTVANLVGGFRVVGSRGNFPWYVVFTNTAGETVMYRVVRGKGGVDNPRATRVMPNSQ